MIGVLRCFFFVMRIIFGYSFSYVVRDLLEKMGKRLLQLTNFMLKGRPKLEDKYLRRDFIILLPCRFSTLQYYMTR